MSRHWSRVQLKYLAFAKFLSHLNMSIQPYPEPGERSEALPFMVNLFLWWTGKYLDCSKLPKETKKLALQLYTSSSGVFLEFSHHISNIPTKFFLCILLQKCFGSQCFTSYTTLSHLSHLVLIASPLAEGVEKHLQ